ncbi:MAG: PBP1A family penicillin-binding protein [Elusimicrobia bacterium]|nr:PBP1A family penicillin-binding protein [Elusimicrobiota bacterium]
MSKTKNSGFLLTGVLLLLAAGVGAYSFRLWSHSLFGQLALITSKRELRRPVQFYSDARALRAGEILSPKEVERLLQERDYSPLPDTTPPVLPGQYRFSGENGMEVFVKPFNDPDAPQVAGLFRLDFEEGSLSGITAIPDGDSLTEIRLEPLPLSGSTGGSAETSLWVPLEKIPPALITAVVHSEDRRFYQHHGIDFRGLLRAAWINFRGSGIQQGGSTLTQQMVKNAFLTPERTFRRKLKEMALALALEWRYGKNDILEMYLNQIYLGRDGLRGLYGVEEASRSFFGKPVSDLSLDECALLASLIPSPNKYHPRHSPVRARRRRDQVLALLRRQNQIPEPDYQEAARRPIALAPVNDGIEGLYYATWVRQILEEEFPGALLDTAGFRVHTAMDMDLQKAAEKAAEGKSKETVTEPREAKKWLEGASPETAVVALDPYTGHVKALVGGRNYNSSPYNRAVLSRRQPGSAFKPILFAAALESHEATLATFLEDQPLRLRLGSREWKPRNYDGKYRGAVSAREALVHSINIPAIHLLEKTGTDAVLELAAALGIRSPLRPNPSLALGTSEVTPLEITTAYAAFVNGGHAVKPLFIRWIEDPRGNVVRRYEPDSRPVLSSETSALMTNVLQDVVERGTGRNARTLGFVGPAAGKTGTSDNHTDAWFIGFTPRLLCGVWRGNDLPASLGRSASALAIPVWVQVMKSAPGRNPAEEFPKNRKLVQVKVDPANGLRARMSCPTPVSELFVRGTAPEDACPDHIKGLPKLLNRFWGWFKKP